MMLTRAEIYKVLDGERVYQRAKWGFLTEEAANVERVELTTDMLYDAPHDIEAFILYMEDYLEEARHQISRSDNNNLALGILRKVTALGIACAEQHGMPPRVNTSGNPQYIVNERLQQPVKLPEA